MSKSRVKKGLVGLIALFSLSTLWGCQPSGSPAGPSAKAYSYQSAPANQGPKLSDVIEFKEERLKTRPKSFLEQAELASLYLQRFKALKQGPDLEKARFWLEKSLGEIENASALLAKADLLQMEHHFVKCHEVLDRVLKMEPGKLSAIVMKVRVYLAQGLVEEANTLLSSVREQPLFSLLFLRGMVAEDMGDLEQARRYYSEALAREKELGSPAESARLRAVWARMELREKELGQARALIDSALTIPKKLPTVALIQAELLRQEERSSEASKVLREGFALYQDPVFLIRIGEIERESGNDEGAKESFLAAERLVREDSFGHERDLALVLFYLDPKTHAEEISKLLERELGRRKDRETLRVKSLIQG